MTSTRLWDRAAALPAAVDGRRRPEVAALAAAASRRSPTLFDFMRDAELRFAHAPDADRGADDDGTRRGAHDARCRAPPSRRRQGDHQPRRRDRGRRLRGLDLRRRARADVLRRPPARARSDRSATARAASTTRTSRASRRSTSRSRRCPFETLPGDVRPPGGLLPERARDRPLRRDRHRTRPRTRGDPSSAATIRGRPSSPATGPTSTSSLAVDRDDRDHRPPRGDRSAGRDPRCRGRRPRPGCARCRPRSSISSSPPGRRCSTDREGFRSPSRERV